MDKRKVNLFKYIFILYLVSVIVMLFKLHKHDVLKDMVPDSARPGPPADHFQKYEAAAVSTKKEERNTTTKPEPIEVPRIPEHHNHYIYGPGVNGTGINLPPDIEARLVKYRDRKHGFNTLLSDIVGLHREWKNCPNPKCADKVYPEVLPKVSIVIIFRDEYPSIVLRTAYSVLEHSDDLVEEVILVDDGSIDEELKLIVDIHVTNVDKLKLITNEEPLGLMMARQRGIEHCSSDYFVVMDGHMEVCQGWLKPVLTRLLEMPRALLSPCVTDVSGVHFGMQGCEVFDEVAMYFNPLTLNQAWVPFRPEYRRARHGGVEPLEFAVTQGMIVAMRKDFFLQLGGFDPGMKIWGTEQMELSVKVWMCGGRVEMIPCSRVTHMFRTTPWNHVKGSHHINNNRLRFASVWLDGSHREAVLAYQMMSGGTLTDVSDRVKIRRENNCKPFSYFQEQVSRFIDVFSLENATAIGPVRNLLTNTCLDNLVSKSLSDSNIIGSYSCVEKNPRQYFVLTEKSQIRFRDYIFIANRTMINVEKSTLMHRDGNTFFTYTDADTIVQRQTGLCVTAFSESTDVKLLPCDGNQGQIWKWKRWT